MTSYLFRNIKESDKIHKRIVWLTDDLENIYRNAEDQTDDIPKFIEANLQ